MQTFNCPPGDSRPQKSRAETEATASEVQPPLHRIFTIGHSNHDSACFIELLGCGDITLVADVRSSPFSQRQPQYNEPELRGLLQTSGIRYEFMGNELGGRPRDIAVYDGEGRVDYWRVRRTRQFQAGLARLLEVSRHDAVALLCAEEDPLDCHRGLMIAAELAERGIYARHVRGNGSIESTPQLETRLFEITGVGGGMATGLFAASLPASERAELLRDAYKAQARRKAFRLPAGQSIDAIDSLSESSIE